jgi:hypothetical protein
MVAGVEEEGEVGAWLRRCWMASTEEEDEEEGGQRDETRDRGGEEGSCEGGSESDVASAVASPPLGLCVVGGAKKGKEEGVRPRAKRFCPRNASPSSQPATI